MRRLLVAAVLVTAATAGTIAYARLEPLALGGLGTQVRTSATGYSLSNSLMEPSAVVLKYEPGAKVMVEFSVMTSEWPPVELVDLDETIEEWRESIPPCFWQPTSGRVLSSGMHGEPQREPVSLPHTLEPQADILIVQVTGEIGDARHRACGMKGLATLWLEAPLRFRWLGVTRTQTVPLDLKLGISENPGDHTTMDVTPLPSLATG
ncbi:MAG: hypothetical protein HOQ38_17055 [Nonomuraea sp.]|nr:hypothetical protein [Nonomuraea sp.]